LNRLRNRLILVFLAATLVPFGVTLWITASLLDQSLSLASTRELDELSRSLETTGRALYQLGGEALKGDVAAGRAPSRVFGEPASSRPPESVREFLDSGEPERFQLAVEDGTELEYMVRSGSRVLVYTKPLGGPGLRKISEQHTRARSLIERAAARDLRRGFRLTFILLAASTWIVSMTALILWAHRISRPIQKLTAGLAELTAGNLKMRVEPTGDDEVGTAIRAFNDMALQLAQSRERLIDVTRLASWQSLARKMAHEVKNSLTPIRLTMEELIARGAERDAAFLEQAAQIVVEEVLTLERRVRAFSEFAAEPPIRLSLVDINALVDERVALLRAAHPEVTYQLRLAPGGPSVTTDEDLTKGVLTNLIENAAEAAGGGGVVLATTLVHDGKVTVEVHDSGPGLSVHARSSLFEPAISFKKSGMGLGLSIARKSALLSGGDLTLIDGELGGAAFRLVLPGVSTVSPDPDRPLIEADVEQANSHR